MDPKNKVAKEGKPETAGLHWSYLGLLLLFHGQDRNSDTVYLSVRGITGSLITSHT